MMRALIVEDDEVVAEFVAKGLRQHGYRVDVARDGREGLWHALEHAYDVMVVDRMLPGLDGLAVLKTVRSAGNATPILILSALADVDDRVEGLRAGGDDYLTKPFAFSELAARLEALQRRPRGGGGAAGGPDRGAYRVGDLELDPLRRSAARAGRPIRLLPREFALLEYLMRHHGQAVTRTMLLENVWDYRFDPQTNVVDVHVSRLRAKLERPFPGAEPLIETVRGVGYRLRGPDD